MRSKAALRYAYENYLRGYCAELARRQRYGLPMSPTPQQLDNFIAELRALCAAESEHTTTIKAA